MCSAKYGINLWDFFPLLWNIHMCSLPVVEKFKFDSNFTKEVIILKAPGHNLRNLIQCHHCAPAPLDHMKIRIQGNFDSSISNRE